MRTVTCGFSRRELLSHVPLDGRIAYVNLVILFQKPPHLLGRHVRVLEPSLRSHPGTVQQDRGPGARRWPPVCAMSSLSLLMSSCSSGRGSPRPIVKLVAMPEIFAHGLAVKAQRLADLLDLSSFVPLVDCLHYFIHRYIPPCHDPSIPEFVAIGMAGSCRFVYRHPAKSGELPWPCKWGITLALRALSGDIPWPSTQESWQGRSSSTAR